MTDLPENESIKQTALESPKSLKDTIAILYEMELNNYLMTRMIDTMKKQASNLGYYKNIKAPIKKEAINKGAHGGAFLSIGAVVCSMFGACVGCESSTGIFNAIDNILGGLVIGGLIGGVLGFVLGLLLDIEKKKTDQEEYDTQYSAEYSTYQFQLNRDKIRVERENKSKNLLQSEINSLIVKRDKSKRLLSFLYERSGIDPKFRSIIVMGYMNEYIRLGISNKLEGVDGLYNLIINRIQLQIINDNLDNIANKLDTLISKTDDVYFQICDMNKKCDNMIYATSKAINQGVANNQLLEDIRNNSEISAYNAERIRREYEIQNIFNWK